MCLLFFFNDTATTEIYTLSLHDALPISGEASVSRTAPRASGRVRVGASTGGGRAIPVTWAEDVQGEESRMEATEAREGRSRSEEHTSELQSRQYLVCRLLLEKKKNNSKS